MAKTKSSKSNTPSLVVTQVRGASQCPRDQRECLKGLGLRRIRHTVTREDTPAIRGMIRKVRHLVEFVETAG